MDHGRVLALLRDVKDPLTHKPMDPQHIQSAWDHSTLFVSITAPPKHIKAYDGVLKQCKALLAPHVPKVSLTLTYDTTKASPKTAPLPKALIAISSGKGGVGKSTVALNLAVASAQMGYRTGLVDADIYGPSLPLLINTWDKPLLNDEKKMIPPLVHGVKVQSMGFLVERHQPILWRGPMAQSSFLHLINETQWGDLDVMFIDLPPGTGDIHLSLAQKIPLKGAIIVTTPQDLALIDALKAIKMYETLNVPLMGLIENMSYLVCPACSHTIDIYGHHQAHATAKEHHIPFLGHIPLHLDLRQACDRGTPLAVSHPHHALSTIFKELIVKLNL